MDTSDQPTEYEPIADKPIKATSVTATSKASTSVTATPITATSATASPIKATSKASTSATASPIKATSKASTSVTATSKASTSVTATSIKATSKASTSVTATPIADTSVTATPIADTPIADTPIADTPIADTPITDKPTTDTLTTDTPVTDTLTADTPFTDTLAADTPITDTLTADTPITDSLAADTPTTDTPAADTAVTDAPAHESDADVVKTDPPIRKSRATSEYNGMLSSIDEELAEITDFPRDKRRSRQSLAISKIVKIKKAASEKKSISPEVGHLENEFFQKMSYIGDVNLDDMAEEMEEEKSAPLDESELADMITSTWRKSMVSLESFEQFRPISPLVSPDVQSVIDSASVRLPSYMVQQRKRVVIKTEVEEEEEMEEQELQTDLLEEDEEGNLVHFEEIKKNLKTRVFADRDCPSMSASGEMDRRKARNLKFDPSLLLTHYTLKDLFLRDDYGWAPIHYCAYRGFRQCIKIIINEVPALLEYRTKDGRMDTTPFLLAIMSLDLETIKLFIKLEADLSALDLLYHNAIQLCTFKQAIEIIEFFLAYEDPRLPVWKILVEALASPEIPDALATAKTLNLMTRIKPPWASSCHWREMHKHKITKSFVVVLGGKYPLEVKEETLLTFLNIVSSKLIRVMAVEKDNLVPHLAKLLVNKHSILADLSSICILKLMSAKRYLAGACNTNLMDLAVKMLKKHRNFSSLKNSLDLISHLMKRHKPFADRFRSVDESFDIVVKTFDENRSKTIAFSLLALVENAMMDNPANQDLFSEADLGQHLVKLTKARNRKLMIACLAAIRAMTKDNYKTQKNMEELGVIPNIMTLLKKTRYLTIQELTANTLWTIGGKDAERLWYIAENIGVKVLIEFVESHSKVLELIGTEALAFLNKAPLGVHNAFNACSGTQILTRLLTRTRCPDTVLATIRAIRYSCYKAALVNHSGNQRLAVGDYTVQGCLNNILDLIEKEDFVNADLIKAECVALLAAMMLTNTLAIHDVMENKRFSYCLAIRLLESKEEDIRALAGLALSLMCFNMISIQAKISSYGGIYYADFKKWMIGADTNINRCHFAFQMVILARVFPDIEPAVSAAEGIVQLHELLSLPDSDDYYRQQEVNAVVRQTCNYIAALCHSRPGIPDSYVAIRTLDSLASLLVSPFEQTRAFAAIAFGYLSYEPSAKRWILRKFRHDTYLLEIMVFYTRDNKCNPSLLESWKYLEYVGLPPKDYSRGILTRPRVDQLLSEPRPHILTGIEDPHSGVLGASTVEKDDYDDELVFTDDPEERKKIVSNRPDKSETGISTVKEEKDLVPCLARLRMEREQKEEEEYLRRLEEMEALEEEEEEEKEEFVEVVNDEDEDEDDDDEDERVTVVSEGISKASEGKSKASAGAATEQSTKTTVST